MGSTSESTEFKSWEELWGWSSRSLSFSTTQSMRTSFMVRATPKTQKFTNQLQSPMLWSSFSLKRLPNRMKTPLPSFLRSSVPSDKSWLSQWERLDIERSSMLYKKLQRKNSTKASSKELKGSSMTEVMIWRMKIWTLGSEFNVESREPSCLEARSRESQSQELSSGSPRSSSWMKLPVPLMKSHKGKSK